MSQKKVHNMLSVSFVLFGFVLVLTAHFGACNVLRETVSDERVKRAVNTPVSCCWLYISNTLQKHKHCTTKYLHKFRISQSCGELLIPHKWLVMLFIPKLWIDRDSTTWKIKLQGLSRAFDRNVQVLLVLSR